MATAKEALSSTITMAGTYELGDDDASNAIKALADAGYVIVPREPTKGMLSAGAKGSGEDSESVARGAWDAMVTAATTSI